MCGIVGYTGKEQAVPILLDGLAKLEYRGYDSAGICVCEKEQMHLVKAKGKLENLKQKIGDTAKFAGTAGIGHTRWATHGAPSDINSHPHMSDSGKIALVHNGIIENEAALRCRLKKQGVRFCSETDTEVIANLVGVYYDERKDFLQAVRCAVEQLEGSFALGIMCSDYPGTIIAAKKDSPLIFGFGEEGNFIASDTSALIKYTRTVTYLGDGELAIFTGNTVRFYNAFGEPVEKQKEVIRWKSADVQKDGYAHFMLKEIMEQPQALRDTLRPRIGQNSILLDNVCFDKSFLQKVKKIYFVACGSSYYASVLGKYLMEQYCRIPAEAVIASEFRYADPVLDENDLVIFFSQSGETADTIAALKEAKRRGAHTLAIVNVVGSAMAKEADQVLYTWAGPEISVATTKAFSTQLAALWLLTTHIAQQLGTVSNQMCKELLTAFTQYPDTVKQTLSGENLQTYQLYAKRYYQHQNVFYIGRNVDYAVCLEGSLKLKEIAYLHSEAYPAGELKHGPISLLEQGTLVIAMATVEQLLDKTLANIREVMARGAQVLCITLEGMEERFREVTDHVISVPKTHPMLQSGLNLIPLQLFAYYVAVFRGCDVDKPRNLAKSVTVE